MEYQQIAPSKEVAAATGVKRKSKLKSRGGGQGNGSRCDGTSVLEKVTANNDDAITTKSSLSNNSNVTAPVTPGGGQHDINTFANNVAIDLTSSTPTKKVASEDHFLLSPVVEIVSKAATTTTSLSIHDSSSSNNNNNSKRKRVSTSPSSLEKSSNNEVEKKKKKKKKKKSLPGDDTSNATPVSAASSKQKKSKDENGADKNTKPTAASTAVTASNNVASAATSKKSSSTPTKQPPKKIKKRSFHDQILFTMLTSNKPYNLKSLAKATKTTVEQLNHAMLSFVDKGLVVVKEFPGKNGKEGKKLYWATTVTLSDNNDGTKKQKKGSDGAIQKELSKLLATPSEIKEVNEMHTKLEEQYKSIQDELQPLLKIPTTKGLDDDINAEEEKLKSVQNEIDAIRTRIQEQSEKKSQQVSKPVIQYGGYYRMMQQKKRNTAPSRPPDPTTLKRKINYMLSEYKGRKRKCMDFVNDLADAMEKHPREVMNNDKILGLDTDEMEWGWWLDCSSGKVFGKKPKVQKKSLLGGRGGRYGVGAKQEEQEEGKDEPTIKIPAKYVDI